MKLLIPGGAGYIGSHTVKYCQEAGHEVVVLDDFSTGNSWAIKDCEILEVNLLDELKLAKVLKNRNFDGIIHFAAKSIVGESISKPDFYYQNNVSGTLNLLNEMIKNNIANIVFSSTASIFGNPITDKIDETHPQNPINPYGMSKMIVENILNDYCSAFGINATCLRYFNAAGADPSCSIGEAHNPETHLIPNILKSVITNKNDLRVFGNDYPTPDGTCIRDYVHVNDLAEAHLISLQKSISENTGLHVFNLGYANGYSILDIIKATEHIVGKSIKYNIYPRRLGDPPTLVADNSRAISKLGWSPKHSEIHYIIESAWNWHKKYIQS